VNVPSLSLIATRILEVTAGHPTRVGIDGFCASGKTTLADALALELRAAGREVVRVCGDNFQNPPEVRWQLGRRSPEGFLRHSIDFPALRTLLLEPLGPNGSRNFRSSCYDVHASRVNLSVERTARDTAVLLLDGLFLHAPPLEHCFDFTIFVDAEFETCLRRALGRKQERSDDLTELEAVYREKYIPGFELYCREVGPRERASGVVTT
jgi:uridine kinase